MEVNPLMAMPTSSDLLILSILQKIPIWKIFVLTSIITWGWMSSWDPKKKPQKREEMMKKDFYPLQHNYILKKGFLYEM